MALPAGFPAWDLPSVLPFGVPTFLGTDHRGGLRPILRNGGAVTRTAPQRNSLRVLAGTVTVSRGVKEGLAEVGRIVPAADALSAVVDGDH